MLGAAMSVVRTNSPTALPVAEATDKVGFALLEMTHHARGIQDKTEMLRMLRQLAVALCRLFSPFCEVVIHDFTDFEHSIICIEGNVTNRRIGGAATDLLLTKVSQGDTDEDLYNYLTNLPGGRMMKSCTVWLREGQGPAFGAFCVNFDMTAFVSVQKVLDSFVTTEERSDVVETFANDIEDAIHSIVTTTLYETGQSLPLMGRDEKVDLIGRLADKGVFQVKKSVSILADQLGLSRATVYNYLREARMTNSDSPASTLEL
jgi:predicted transcriptional regulator YheO